MVRIETLLKITTYICALTGLAAVLPYVNVPYLAGFAVLAALAVLRDGGAVNVAVPRLLLNILSVAVVVPSALRISPENLVEPVLEGLAPLLGIKLLEEKKGRDYMQVYLICMFLLIGSTLVSMKISFLLYFFPLALLSTTALILLAFHSHDPKLAVDRHVVPRLFSQALLTCAIAMPASALFFVILPRTDFPLFSFFGKVETARSGFSDSVSLGDVAEIQEDPSAVLRAEMPVIADNDLYWRGVELDRFNGLSWEKGVERPRESWEITPERGGTRQTIYMEPSMNRYLFALDRPVAIYAGGVRRRKSPNANLWYEKIGRRIRYEAVSIPSVSAVGDEIDLKRYLELPPGFSPRISELAGKIAGQGGDPVANLANFLRSGSFEYSLDGLPRSDTPLEDFLFEGKRGNCEYFASALGAMLRSTGTPARLVAGYRGGYYNPAGKYYLVLQKNAHVWVEAYSAGRWIRIDPTPIFPQTPEDAYRDNLLLQVRLLLDTFDYYWGKFVIGFDLSRQIAMWEKVKSALKWPRLDPAGVRVLTGAFAPYAAAAFAVLGTALLIFWRVRRGTEKILVSRFVRRMKKRGYRRGRTEGLEEFSCRVSEPELKAKAAAFVSEFQDVFYRDQKFSAEETKRLKSLVRCL